MNKVKLNENEMDRASLILATKSVVDDLQDMAEKIAKMEAEGIMPLLDGIRDSFGPDFADRLSAESTEALRGALEALKGAKERISANTANMEQIVTGEGPGNDMATNLGVPDQEEVAPEGEAGELPAEDEGGEVDIDDIFSDEPSLGREAKTSESAKVDPINMLRESKDPDGMLLRETFKRMKAGKTGLIAMTETAAKFGVDVEDVIAIAKERTKK